ncbi:MAG: serine hydrolase [Candidatus Heimdallarchaeota archaeon]|nr:serine hydrolase [Candidatus Heimdallarchaeota archaeon]
MLQKNSTYWMIVSILILLFAGSSFTSSSTSLMIFPDETWVEALPDDQGLDVTLIDEMIEYVDTKTLFDSMVLVKNGYLIAETYKFVMGENETKHLWGITKGITSLLTAIAISEGFIESLDSKVFDYFTDRNISNYSPSKDNITIRHILTSSSGLEWQIDEYMFAAWISAEDKVQYMLDLPMKYEPGTQYVENTGSMHLLTTIINITTGMFPIDFAKQYLYNPLGIEEVTWTDDGTGVNYGGHGLYLRTRDLTRIGHLLLNNGSWNGNQIIPEETIVELLEPVWNLTLENDHERKLACRFYSIEDYNLYTAMGSTMLVMAVLPEYNIALSLTSSSIDSKPPDEFYTILDDYLLPAMIDPNMSETSGIPMLTILSSTIIFLAIYRRRDS